MSGAAASAAAAAAVATATGGGGNGGGGNGAAEEDGAGPGRKRRREREINRRAFFDEEEERPRTIHAAPASSSASTSVSGHAAIRNPLRVAPDSFTTLSRSQMRRDMRKIAADNTLAVGRPASAGSAASAAAAAAGADGNADGPAGASAGDASSSSTAAAQATQTKPLSATDLQRLEAPLLGSVVLSSTRPPCAPESSIARKRHRYMAWVARPDMIEEDLATYRATVEAVRTETDKLEQNEANWRDAFPMLRRHFLEVRRTAQLERVRLEREGQDLLAMAEGRLAEGDDIGEDIGLAQDAEAQSVGQQLVGRLLSVSTTLRMEMKEHDRLRQQALQLLQNSSSSASDVLSSALERAQKAANRAGQTDISAKISGRSDACESASALCTVTLAPHVADMGAISGCMELVNVPRGTRVRTPYGTGFLVEVRATPDDATRVPATRVPIVIRLAYGTAYMLRGHVHIPALGDPDCDPAIVGPSAASAASGGANAAGDGGPTDNDLDAIEAGGADPVPQLARSSSIASDGGAATFEHETFDDLLQLWAAAEHGVRQFEAENCPNLMKLLPDPHSLELESVTADVNLATLATNRSIARDDFARPAEISENNTNEGHLHPLNPVPPAQMPVVQGGGSGRKGRGRRTKQQQQQLQQQQQMQQQQLLRQQHQQQIQQQQQLHAEVGSDSKIPSSFGSRLLGGELTEEDTRFAEEAEAMDAVDWVHRLQRRTAAATTGDGMDAGANGTALDRPRRGGGSGGKPQQAQQHPLADLPDAGVQALICQAGSVAHTAREVPLLIHPRSIWMDRVIGAVYGEETNQAVDAPDRLPSAVYPPPGSEEFEDEQNLLELLQLRTQLTQARIRRERLRQAEADVTRQEQESTRSLHKTHNHVRTMLEDSQSYVNQTQNALRAFGINNSTPAVDSNSNGSSGGGVGGGGGGGGGGPAARRRAGRAASAQSASSTSSTGSGGGRRREPAREDGAGADDSEDDGKSDSGDGGGGRASRRTRTSVRRSSRQTPGAEEPAPRGVAATRRKRGGRR